MGFKAGALFDTIDKAWTFIKMLTDLILHMTVDRSDEVILLTSLYFCRFFLIELIFPAPISV